MAARLLGFARAPLWRGRQKRLIVQFCRRIFPRVVRVRRVGRRFLTGGRALTLWRLLSRSWAGRGCGRRCWRLVSRFGAALLERLHNWCLLIAALAINGQPDRQAGQDQKTKRDNADSDHNSGIHLIFPFASNTVGRVPLASMPCILSEQSITWIIFQRNRSLR